MFWPLNTNWNIPDRFCFHARNIRGLFPLNWFTLRHNTRCDSWRDFVNTLCWDPLYSVIDTWSTFCSFVFISVTFLFLLKAAYVTACLVIARTYFANTLCSDILYPIKRDLENFLLCWGGLLCCDLTSLAGVARKKTCCVSAKLVLWHLPIGHQLLR
jgi:hypothetical protein